MKIIDAHVHTLPDPEADAHAEQYGIDFTEEGLRKECEENGVQQILSLADTLKAPTPTGLDRIYLVVDLAG